MAGNVSNDENNENTLSSCCRVQVALDARSFVRGKRLTSWTDDGSW